MKSAQEWADGVDPGYVLSAPHYAKLREAFAACQREAIEEAARVAERALPEPGTNALAACAEVADAIRALVRP